jgi:hypothetical protein
MDETEIRKWVDVDERGRAWLADQLAVSKGTVNNWFSLGFPPRVRRAITRLAQRAGSDTGSLAVTFTDAQFDRIELARRIGGYPTRAALYKEAIEEFTDKLIAEANRSGTGLSEDIKPYNGDG